MNTYVYIMVLKRRCQAPHRSQINQIWSFNIKLTLWDLRYFSVTDLLTLLVYDENIYICM